MCSRHQHDLEKIQRLGTLNIAELVFIAQHSLCTLSMRKYMVRTHTIQNSSGQQTSLKKCIKGKQRCYNKKVAKKCASQL